MTRCRRALLLIAGILACGSVTATARDETNFLHMQKWARAVVAHQPGTADDALTVVWTLTPDDRQYISDRLENFVVGFDKSRALRPGQEHTPQGLANELATTIAADDFLERAAILHADAVMSDRRPAAAAAAVSQPASRWALAQPHPGTIVTSTVASRPGETVSPFVTSVDGEVTGRAAENWNWPFARLLLDQLHPREPDGFVATWYHATAAYLLSRGDLAEAGAHLSHAKDYLRDDARIDFDRACLAEALAMDVIQQIVGTNGPEAVANRYAAARWIGESSARIPSAASSNAQALDLFQQAAALDPGLIEARVRAARLLELDGRFADASDQIRQAILARPADQRTAFYAHLFGARAALALGQDADADAHVRAALALYPSADSAILAASQLAFHEADAVTAELRMNELADRARAQAPTVDPWREYMFGAGRNVESLLQEMWHAVPPRVAR